MSEHSLTSLLRREALRDPVAALRPAVAQPVVHPARPALPELHGVRADDVPAPLLRRGHLLGVPGLRLLERARELLPGGDPRLVGGPGAQLRTPRPAGE